MSKPYAKACKRLVLLALIYCLPWMAQAMPADIRIVIDVSGSMKQNDPHNLRLPSLRLLSGLMPAQSRSGVWLFATQANQIVPLKQIDDSWRSSTYAAAEKIHSRGQYTDIEKALNAAISNTSADAVVRPHIILLSDGMVDLAKGDSASQQSRQRIIDDILPKIKQQEIEVHTIALSANADQELLKLLSTETNGWFRQVDTADELERIFLHLFEQATQRDMVPISDNHFSIDTSIAEMTVLIFRERNSNAAVLVKPDQQLVDQSMQGTDVRWQHEQHYDLVTIEQPMAGDWYIDAAIDPDNRVMVVTDLQLETNDLPNHVLVGERFDMSATLTEQGDAIERESFLQLVETTLTQQPVAGETQQNPLYRPVNQQTFRAELGALFEVGRNDIIITAKGPTFERQRRQSINLIAVPMQIDVIQLETALRTHRLTISTDSNLLATDDLQITALLKSPEGIEFPYEASLQSDNQWQLTLTDLQPGLEYSLALQVRGYTPLGRPVFLQPKAVSIKDANSTASMTQQSEPILEQQQQPYIKAETNIETAPDAAATEQTVEAMDDDQPLLSNRTILIIGNVLFLMMLVFGLWMWQRHRKHYAVSGELI